jgi:tRNA (cmo5U34)-methyltransferase
VNPPGSASPRVARGFDRLAPLYDLSGDLALAGRIHASQVTLLPRLPSVRRALVLGGGTGRFLEAFLNHDPEARVVSIDASPGMTRRTEDRINRSGQRERVELRGGGLEKLGPDERFDLVVTHYFLDLFADEELHGVMESLNRTLVKEGHWLFSDFRQRSVAAVLYPFFRATCGISADSLPDFDRAFAPLGLEEVHRTRLAFGILEAVLFRKPSPAQGTAGA